jgi:hypothetical protein
MTMIKRIGALLLIAIAAVLIVGLSERSSVPGKLGFVSTAEAVVGRPGTPASVAGVARRSARRCATGVYDC